MKLTRQQKALLWLGIALAIEISILIVLLIKFLLRG